MNLADLKLLLLNLESKFPGLDLDTFEISVAIERDAPHTTSRWRMDISDECVNRLEIWTQED